MKSAVDKHKNVTEKNSEAIIEVETLHATSWVLVMAMWFINLKSTETPICSLFPIP